MLYSINSRLCTIIYYVVAILILVNYARRIFFARIRGLMAWRRFFGCVCSRKGDRKRVSDWECSSMTDRFVDEEGPGSGVDGRGNRTTDLRFSWTSRMSWFMPFVDGGLSPAPGITRNISSSSMTTVGDTPRNVDWLSINSGISLKRSQAFF